MAKLICVVACQMCIVTVSERCCTVNVFFVLRLALELNIVDVDYQTEFIVVLIA